MQDSLPCSCIKTTKALDSNERKYWGDRQLPPSSQHENNEEIITTYLAEAESALNVALNNIRCNTASQTGKKPKNADCH
jgi:hypothetical protein